MNRDKQIEEMACKRCLHFEACQIAFRNSKELGIYDCTEEEYFNSTLDCDYYTDKNIYRKASEVAKEMIEELRKVGITESRYPVIAELKKKFTEENK